MARRWALTAGVELNETGVGANAYPMTMSLWFYKQSPKGAMSLLSYWNTYSGVKERHHMGLLSGSGGVYCTSQNSAGTSGTASGGSYSTGTWHHLLAKFSNASARTIYIDSLFGFPATASDTTTVTWAGVTGANVGIGSEASISLTHATKCRIAEVGIWKSNLNFWDVKALSHNASPLLIEPENLIAYYKLVRTEDWNEITGATLSTVGSPQVAAHQPDIVYPSAPRVLP